MSAALNLLSFPAQSAPQSLVEKYRPARIQDFAGIATVKETMLRFVEQPRKSAWMFVGESGTGKSTMANLVAELIDAQLTFVPSQECTVDRLRWVIQICRSYPMSGQRFNLVLVDEADLMSKAARDYLLSTLDNLPPDCIFIFTCNDMSNFEPRFLSRTRILKFGNYRIQEEAASLLARIWEAEAPGKTGPNFTRMVKEWKGEPINGNIRAALMALEMELMLA